MKALSCIVTVFFATLLVIQAQQDVLTSTPSGTAYITVHMDIPEGVSESEMTFLAFEQGKSEAEKAYYGAELQRRMMSRAKKDLHDTDVNFIPYNSTNTDEYRSIFLSLLQLVKTRSESASNDAAVSRVFDKVIEDTCQMLKRMSANVGEDIDCSNMDMEMLADLQKRMEIYELLYDITELQGNPFEMITPFQPSSLVQHTSDYWNSRVLSNCTSTPADLSNGAAAAHASESRYIMNRLSSIHFCCVHSTFDPNPVC